MQKWNHLILTSAILAISSLPIEAEVLEGALQFSDKMPELGKYFNLTAFKTNTDDDSWFVIPEWLAGEWRSESGRLVEGKVPNEFLEEKEIFGHQRDKIGNIWNSAEDTLVQGNSGNRSFEVIRVYTPIEISNDKAIFKMTNSIVQKDSSNKVVSVKRSEAIRRICKGAFDRISVFTEFQSYDDTGFKTSKGKYEEFRRLDNEFQTRDDIGDKSLKASFNKYLLKSGKLEIQK